MKNSVKKILAVLLASATLAAALTSCDTGDDTPESTSPDTTEAVTEEVKKGIPFLVDGESGYAFVRADEEDEAIKTYISRFYWALRDKYTEADIDLKSDYLKRDEVPGEKEINIGTTNRDGAADFMETIPENCFGIKVSENSVFINGKNARLINMALEYFTENFLKENENGDIYIPDGEYISEPVIFGISTIISTDEGFTSASEKLYDVPNVDGHRIMQGGCTDGEYMYYAMVTSGDTQTCYVHKYSIETGELVKTSADLATDHSNDLTYNPNTNEIVICHNAPVRTRVTFLDADTLEFKRMVNISYNIFSIAYQPERNVYVLGLSGGQDFTVVDENFVIDRDYIPSGTKFTANSTGYTTQGVECDEEYIYFVQYKQNVIMVYDWAGNFITRVDLDIPSNTEPENISLVGDRFYIACNNSSWSGGIVYSTELISPNDAE